MAETRSPEEKTVLMLKKSRYQDALDFAAERIKIDPNNHNLYFLKATANIYMNRIQEALLDLGEAIYLNPQHVPTMQALAYIFIRQGDYEGAINKWLSILERDPKNPVARRNLSLFKKEAPNKAALNLNPERYIDLPHIASARVQFPWKKISVSFLLALTIALGSVWLFRYFAGKPFELLPGLSLDFPDKIRFTLTDKEIEFYKKEIFEQVNNQEFNKAKKNMNKIYLSNAALEDKKLLKTWETRLNYPTSKTLKENYGPSEVFANPDLYQGCFVAWKGIVTAVVQQDQLLFFKMTADNEEIAATYLVNYPLKENMKVSLLGRLLFQNQQLKLEVYELSVVDE